MNIFCSFIQNKIEEADFLNSLLLDTNDNDDYFLIVRTKELKYCHHCFHKREGFSSFKKNQNYHICKSCLYNPCTNMVNNLFIAVSKIKNPERFNKLLNEINLSQFLKLKIQSDLTNY